MSLGNLLYWSVEHHRLGLKGIDIFALAAEGVKPFMISSIEVYVFMVVSFKLG
jgi:hypothetical protein